MVDRHEVLADNIDAAEELCLSDTKRWKTYYILNDECTTYAKWANLSRHDRAEA